MDIACLCVFKLMGRTRNNPIMEDGSMGGENLDSVRSSLSSRQFHLVYFQNWKVVNWRTDQIVTVCFTVQSGISNQVIGAVCNKPYTKHVRMMLYALFFKKSLTSTQLQFTTFTWELDKISGFWQQAGSKSKGSLV